MIELLTINEAAKQYRVSRSLIVRAIDAGKIPFFPRSAKRNRKVTPSDVEAWISSEFSKPKRPPIDERTRKAMREQLGLHV